MSRPLPARLGRLYSILAAGFVVVLAVPLLLSRADRPVQVRQAEDGLSRFEQVLLEEQTRRIEGCGRPRTFAPHPERAPFGAPVAPRYLQGKAAAGKLLTPWGHVGWKEDGDELSSQFPREFRVAAQDERRAGPGRRLAPGLNYLRLSEQALATRGSRSVIDGLSRSARIIGVLPERTLVVYVAANGMSRLWNDPAVELTRPVAPYEKIARDYGVRPEMNRREAENPHVMARITFVPGLFDERLEQRITSIPGVSELVVEPFDGGIIARLDTAALARIARLPEVLRIDPVRDVMALNAEMAATVQMGSAEDGLMTRPFDRAGVDGGGIDTSGDGRRINDGSDAVPPQIVLVTDNGISLDTPNFSQTATEVVGTAPAIPIGPSHRKVHAIQVVEDDGTGCDAALSGAGTHGNIVAAAIAAYPSELGFFASGSGVDSAGAPPTANLDGVARGARILVQDVADPGRCTINALIERGGDLAPGSLAARLNEAICPSIGGSGACAGISGGGSEVSLAVFPFGVPNFGLDMIMIDPDYSQDAVDIDTFLYNNRDFMVVVPVGNDGVLIGNGRVELGLNVIPDYFDGTDADDDGNDPVPIQTSAPATAKNIVAVGASTGDCFTVFGIFDCEGSIARFSSRGPATVQSLRMVPLITAPAVDLMGGPNTDGVAVFRSRDDDNLPPVEAQLDEGGIGTSFAAAYVTGAAAVIRDYFAQGFHPSGARVDADRVANVSGALIKAALAASADFNEGGISHIGESVGDALLRRTRALDMGVIGGMPVGIMGNSEQGYGRAVLTHVLPLADWSNDFVLHPVSGAPKEYPAAGLLVWDAIATDEPLIDNTTTSRSHSFLIGSARVGTAGGGGLAVTTGQLRISLAWVDPPSPAGSGGPLTNDLDLMLEGPGPDNCLESSDTQPDGSPCPAQSADDNIFYVGNHYGPASNNPSLDQWSIGTGGAPPAGLSDRRNVVEAIHMSGDPDNDGEYDGSPLYVGRWRVTAKRGAGGALPGQITILGPDEDANDNHRLDPGEDGNANGLLDQPGQTYSLVVAGSVFLAETPPPAGPATYPRSALTLDKVRYGCADDLVATILDTTGGGSPAQSQSSTLFEVFDEAGALLDTEPGVAFSAAASPGVTVSAGLPVRLAAPALAGNGLLEAGTGDTIAVTYAPPGQRAVSARAEVNCSPDLINGFFTSMDGLSLARQVVVGGGCDEDDHLDAGEIVTYGIELRNRSRSDDYADLTAHLAVSGPGAAAVQILDSPQEIGRLPGAGTNAVYFHIRVDAATADALPPDDRVVSLTLTLDSLLRGVRLEGQSFTFMHAINSDTEARFYSTDYAGGGREVRDLNRNLAIDPPGIVDPTLQFFVPPEDVTFSSMFVPSGAGGLVSNTLGEDLDDSGDFSGGEADLIPNGVIDGGILDQPSGPGAGDRVPWSFDLHDGGFEPFRHPGGTAGSGDIPDHPTPVWERTTTGICGFQTSAGDGQSGIWHTGDADAATPLLGDTVCDNHLQPQRIGATPLGPFVFDVLVSPIIARVNQENDARGFPYVVEFQRFGFNLNIQTVDGYAGGGINIDNDVDDETNSFFGQRVDQYYTRHFGGWPFGTFSLGSPYWNSGIDPGSTDPFQRTFGPFRDRGTPGVVDGADSGYAGVSGGSMITTPGTCDTSTGLCTAPFDKVGATCSGDADCDSNAISEAQPDYLAYPAEDPIGGPPTPLPGVCDGGVNDGGPCQVATQAADCPGSVCTEASNSTAGPVRNFDTTLIGYEGGFAGVLNGGLTSPENIMGLTGISTFVPGAAGNRWQIALGFYAVQGPAGNVDYGIGADDVVFEWKESHPEHEATLGHAPACSRFGSPGQPAGGQCATLTVDRTDLYECNETITVSLFDAKCIVVGAGNSVPLGGPCTTDAECGSGGECTAARPGVEVAIVTDSDGVPFTSGGTTVTAPGTKRYTLDAVPEAPGLFRAEILFSTSSNDADHVFTTAAADTMFTVYYEDPLCDGDRDGQADEASFDNLDGDGVPDSGQPGPCAGGATSGCNDNCDRIHNPLQEDDDGDGIGNLCDVCPNATTTPSDLTAGVCDTATAKCIGGTLDGADFCSTDADCDPPVVDQFFNPGQEDIDMDGVGDVCDFDDADLDGNLNYSDPCPDVWGTGGLPAGELCSTLGQGFGAICDSSTGLCDPQSGCSQHTGFCDLTAPGLCELQGDCDNASCNGSTCAAGSPLSGTCQGSTCQGGALDGLSCASDQDCRPACATNADCGLCIAGNVGVTCQHDSDCDIGAGSETCIGGLNDGLPCAAAVDCAGSCLFGPNVGTACVDDIDCSSSCTSDTDCWCDFDRDLDGVLDKDDNCVLTANGVAQAGIQGVGNQTDSDVDGIGDACDTDCSGAVVVQKCRNAGVDVNGQPMFCAPSGFAYIASGDGPANCDPGIHPAGQIPVAGWDFGAVCVPYTYHPQDGSSVCSTVNDDFDADFVRDNIDNCAAVHNPAIVPATLRQADADRDGLGDACDPAGDLDDGRDGIPDDLVSFGGRIACNKLPLANLVIENAAYQDLDGDLDPFPDTGETGRLVLTIRNDGVALTDATLVLTTAAPGVSCIGESMLTVGSLPAGATVAVGSFNSLDPGFTFTASDTLQSPPLPAQPEKLDFCIDVTANEISGIAAPACFTLLADVDIPFGGTQTLTLGPDGLSGTGDDGVTLENFDLDRDGDGEYTVRDTFLQATAPGIYRGSCSNAPLTECQTIADCPPGGPDDICYSGAYVRGSDTGVEFNSVTAVSCGGFDTPLDNPACILDPDYPMDWHLHCPAGATNCPNVESGACVGGCSFNTPNNGAKAISLPNSMHMGAHFNLSNAYLGDTTHFRTLQGFRSAPLNLVVIPRPGDLDLSMFHIARLMDNNGVGGGMNERQCSDCADVQIQIDTDPDPDVDLWGFWDKLVPYQNVYDKKAMSWSAFATYYCLFTPTDTGMDPPNPRGVHETLCYPLGAWSSCGKTHVSSPASTGDCPGPGYVDPSGDGVWVESRFDLTDFLGQRIRVRWIGESWVFDGFSSSYDEIATAWQTTVQDEGWWLDDIVVTGTIEEQRTPIPDTKPRTGSCPADTCDETIGDGGTYVVLQATDEAGALFDGIISVPAAGQAVRISAIGTTFPGGCDSGAGEYRFLKNGVVVQEYSSKTFYLDAPTASAQYTALARCSTDLTCESATGASLDLAVYSGEGGDAWFGLRTSPPDPSQGLLYDPATQETTLRWWAPGDQTVDLYRGALGPSGGRGSLSSPFYLLDTTPTAATCLLSNLAGVPTTVGSNGSSGAMDQIEDPDPALGSATYYIVSRDGPAGGSINGLGCAAPGVCSNAPGTVCATDGDCGGTTCLTHTGRTLPGTPATGPLGCPSPGDPTRIVRQVAPSDLCP